MIEGLEKSKNEKSMKQDLIPQSTYEGNPTPNQAIDEDEIDLVEVLKTIWKDRKLILKAIGVSVFLGLVIALTSPKEYEASAKLIPESTDGSMNLGGLGGLASLAGINVGSAKPGGSAIPPELYPEVVKSVEYYEVLLKKEFFFENKNQSFTILSYFKEEAPKSLFSHVLSSPSKLISLLKSKEGDAVESARFRGIIRLSKAEEDVIKNINDRVSVNVDEKSGIISVAVKMPDAVAAAEVADFTLDYLQNYITEYKISKQQQTVDFISVQYQDQKVKFEEAQEKLALFNDRNRNVVTNIARTEQQRLQNQYTFAFEIYKGLTQQLEQSKIKLKEDTPIFTVLEPIQIPLQRSSPKRALMMIVSVFLGAVLGIGLIFVKNLYHNVKSQW